MCFTLVILVQINVNVRFTMFKFGGQVVVVVFDL